MSTGDSEELKKLMEDTLGPRFRSLLEDLRSCLGNENADLEEIKQKTKELRKKASVYV